MIVKIFRLSKKKFISFGEFTFYLLLEDRISISRFPQSNLVTRFAARDIQ